MTASPALSRRARWASTLALAALLVAGAAFTTQRAEGGVGQADTKPAGTSPAHHDGHGSDHGRPQDTLRTGAQLAFHDQMRKLWEDHVTWTRLAIVTFADESPSFGDTAERLLANQVDLGHAIAPYYGDAAGEQLTALLHDHITIAVELLQAAKAGDADALGDAHDRWHANADSIADFLSAANPRFWPREEMRADMATHLHQTLAEADAELHGNYAASVTDYEAVHTHILAMADLLSAGIMHQFPAKFR